MKTFIQYGCYLGLVFIIEIILVNVVTCEELVCLRCLGVPYPRDCLRTVRCSSNEKCYVEQVVTESGNIVYNLGCQSAMVRSKGRNTARSFSWSSDLDGNGRACYDCIKKKFGTNCDKITAGTGKRSMVPGVERSMVQDVDENIALMDISASFSSFQSETEDAATGDIVTCAVCCNDGNHCNREQCGQKSGASPNQVYCASCNDVLHPFRCEYIALCNEYDICYTELINFNGEDRYRLGCIEPKSCNNTDRRVQLPVLVGRDADIPDDTSAHASVGRRQTTSNGDDFLSGLKSYCSQCCTHAFGGCNTELCSTSGEVPAGTNVTELLVPPERLDFCRDTYLVECNLHIRPHQNYCQERRYKHYACRETCGTCNNPAHNTGSHGATVITPVVMPRSDCFYDSQLYMGEYSWTYKNESCVNWYDLDAFLPYSFPDGDEAKAGAKCRDPDGRGHPWCYTSIDGEHWGFCDVPYCKECYYRVSEYRGFVSKTRDNVTCTPWLDAQQSQPNLRNTLFVDGSAAAARSYCRDPFKLGHLQCYSNGSLLECDIQQCAEVTCHDDVNTKCAALQKYFCANPYIATTLCPKTCHNCSFGLTSAVNISPPKDRCIDNPEAKCSLIAPVICQNRNDALTQCPKTCRKCNELYFNNTNLQTTTKHPPNTSLSMTSTAPPSTTEANWSTWGSWNCTYIGSACYKLRYRKCSSDGCAGESYQLSRDCNYQDCPSFQTTIAPSTTTQAIHSCQDDPNASCTGDILMLVCSDPTSAARLCPRSCNLCDTCYDYLSCSSDAARQLFCSNDADSKQYCRKTCGKCDEPQVAVYINECGDPVKDVAICVKLHKDVCICDDPDVRTLCDNYCNDRCPNHPRNDTNTGCIPTRRRRYGISLS